jgi:hypothetical protein
MTTADAASKREVPEFESEGLSTEPVGNNCMFDVEIKLGGFPSSVHVEPNGRNLEGFDIQNDHLIRAIVLQRIKDLFDKTRFVFSEKSDSSPRTGRLVDNEHPMDPEMSVEGLARIFHEKLAGVGVVDNVNVEVHEVDPNDPQKSPVRIVQNFSWSAQGGRAGVWHAY